MRRQKLEIGTERFCGMGVMNGQVVMLLGNWMDANHNLHFRVRLPSGHINPDVNQDEISLDPKVVTAKMN